jgi:hypothetical protein
MSQADGVGWSQQKWPCKQSLPGTSSHLYFPSRNPRQGQLARTASKVRIFLSSGT